MIRILLTHHWAHVFAIHSHVLPATWTHKSEKKNKKKIFKYKTNGTKNYLQKKKTNNKNVFFFRWNKRRRSNKMNPLKKKMKIKHIQISIHTRHRLHWIYNVNVIHDGFENRRPKSYCRWIETIAINENLYINFDYFAFSIVS